MTPLLIAILLTLPGCGSVDSIVSTPVNGAILAAILEHFRTSMGWTFHAKKDNLGEKRRRDRHRGFFVYRRASTIGEEFEDWVAEEAQPRLRNRIRSELLELEAYVNGKLGTK